MNQRRLAMLAMTLPILAQFAWAQESDDTEPAYAAAPDAYQEDISNYDQRNLRGWTVHINHDLPEQEPDLFEHVLFQLEYDLENMEHFLSEPQLERLKTVNIWVELQGAVVPGGMSGRGMCYHVSEGWLTSNGLLAEKTGGVEIVNAADFPQWRKNQPYMTFHEFSHAYHKMLGYDNPDVARVYEQAMEEGLYDEVHRNTATDGKPVRAYAATNPVEYFAEISEAYFGLNDFFPYTRRQLRAHDPRGYELVEKLWSLSTDELQNKIDAAKNGRNREDTDENDSNP